MPQLSPEGQAAINAISQRTGFSPDAVTSMLFSVIAGNGSMAQFSHPEFGGSGQWMRGGMTMVSDMFNNYLKGRVDGLCSELSNLVASQPGLTQTGSFQSQNQGGGNFGSGQWQSSGGGMGMGGNQSSLFVPDASGNFNWWPADLGQPASTGAQNSVRYAYFPGSHRLAIDLNGQVTVYDSLDHQIGGFSQQQGGSGSLTFTSQYGTVFVSNLPIVSGAPQAPAQAQAYAPPPPVYDPPPQQQQTYVPQPQTFGNPLPPLGQNEVISAIEKLADLHAKGILSDQEFSTKKAELLSRL
ncbi:SHOCT domain-containing protein [Xanthobacter oligotrophicus]|uniref:SHOCT domain-containing protein n=1 Tax=Xanthobacter oligotrophicus TaxID=2607286 RepID=UPI0011F3CF95|nr:SHOCT domain-containing protein [Xanthobacter oligotrophicus]MCG5235912.1 SHOCT domain-containing protein [Xanthobacter oligotrophicus]